MTKEGLSLSRGLVSPGAAWVVAAWGRGGGRQRAETRVAAVPVAAL